VSGVANTPLAGRRFFHFASPGVQVVSDGNDRKQHDQRAAKTQQALQGADFVSRTGTPPQAEGGQGQQQPGEIEQQFHVGIHKKRHLQDTDFHKRLKMRGFPKQLVFQKCVILVNVTGVRLFRESSIVCFGSNVESSLACIIVVAFMRGWVLEPRNVLATKEPTRCTNLTLGTLSRTHSADHRFL